MHQLFGSQRERAEGGIKILARVAAERFLNNEVAERGLEKRLTDQALRGSGTGHGRPSGQDLQSFRNAVKQCVESFIGA